MFQLETAIFRGSMYRGTLIVDIYIKNISLTKTGNVRINVTLKRVTVTTAAVEKQ